MNNVDWFMIIMLILFFIDWYFNRLSRKKRLEKLLKKRKERAVREKLLDDLLEGNIK